ncbi:MAG: sodium-dependent transporter [Synergistaceae bacterium]|jgi:NSS family neurotransmitter:Na+ symporter|nr:sodium-dependent transporter [Synergistaceae bacterium]
MSEQNSSSVRESFASRLGFLFIAAGCAIGLGNVWRFPFITGQYGGAAFVLIYLIFLVILVMPVMVMEFSVGRASRLSAARSFHALEPKGTGWHIFGSFAFLGNVILMMFYTVITGWMLAYVWYNLSGQLNGLTSDQVGAVFGALTADPKALIFWMGLTIIIGSVICYKGLQSSVEPVTKWMMSGLFVIMIVLAVRSITLPGAEKGLEFYLKPDFNKLIGEGGKGLWTTIYAALGQAFFTMSVGIGSMAIFGSYIGRDHSLMGEAVIVAMLDTIVALSAGLIIFPACAAYGIDAGAGPGLLFVSLPVMFNAMETMGQFWGTLFFLFLSFAAMSTVVATFENIIASMRDMIPAWSRQKACVINMVVIFILALPCALGFNVWSDFAPLGEGTIVLDLEDFIVSNNLLPIGATVYLLFCVTRYGWGWDNFIAEADAGRGLKFPKSFRGFFTYVAPIITIIVFLLGYYNMFFVK